jgi:hypothetical protein
MIILGLYLVGSCLTALTLGNSAGGSCSSTSGGRGPVIYGARIGDGNESIKLFLGCLLVAALMITGSLRSCSGPGLTLNSRLGLSPSADSRS